ncbi:hypothetical protein AB4622_19540, partial [Vibrio splendidus]
SFSYRYLCLLVSFINSKAYINMTLQSVKDRISCRKIELGSVYKKGLGFNLLLTQRLNMSCTVYFVVG